MYDYKHLTGIVKDAKNENRRIDRFLNILENKLKSYYEIIEEGKISKEELIILEAELLSVCCLTIDDEKRLGISLSSITYGFLERSRVNSIYEDSFFKDHPNSIVLSEIHPDRAFLDYTYLHNMLKENKKKEE